MGGTGGDGHREMGCKGPGGQPPPHPPCADRASECSGSPGNNCPVHHLELLEEVWRGWWAWLGGAAPQWREGQGWGEEEASKPGLRTHGPPGGQPQPQGLDPRGIQLAGPCLLRTDIDCFIENLSTTRPRDQPLALLCFLLGKKGRGR